MEYKPMSDISLPMTQALNGNLAKLQRDQRVEDNERPIKLTQPDAPAQAGEYATVELFEKAV